MRPFRHPLWTLPLLLLATGCSDLPRSGGGGTAYYGYPVFPDAYYPYYYPVPVYTTPPPTPPTDGGTTPPPCATPCPPADGGGRPNRPGLRRIIEQRRDSPDSPDAPDWDDDRRGQWAPAAPRRRGR